MTKLLSYILLVAGLVATSGEHCHAEALQPVEQSLQQAGTNRPQLEAAMIRIRPERREGLEFLIANMPVRDLASLGADFLLANTDGAYEAMEKVPWGKLVPKDIFLNDVLPYACVNEQRDNWRMDFMTQFLPLVADCRTPAAAAAKLNGEIFRRFGVSYSTKREKPDQSPYESIATRKASCTGLSILLVAACRSVGVPARFAGIPMWPNNSGNHSWVEVWDNGWHFTGAAEPTGDRLDQGWFGNQARTARRDEPRHSIYATSFRRTTTPFPLVWAPGVDYVPATNVTDRYTGTDQAADAGAIPQPALPADMLTVQLTEYFKADPVNRLSFRFDPALDRLLAENPEAVRKAVWLAYCNGWDRNRARPGLPSPDNPPPVAREPSPRKITWVITPPAVSNHWLQVPCPTNGLVEAECRDNRVTIRSASIETLQVSLDERLVDFRKPVTFEVNGKISQEKVQPSIRILCENATEYGEQSSLWTSRTILNPSKNAGTP